MLLIRQANYRRAWVCGTALRAMACSAQAFANEAEADAASLDLGTSSALGENGLHMRAITPVMPSGFGG